MSEIKHMPITEFRDLGLVAEINRQFLHPLGLALEVTTVGEEGWTADSAQVQALEEVLAETFFQMNPSGGLVQEAAIRILNRLHPPCSEFVSGVWDYRDDPEGIYFAGDLSYFEDLALKAGRLADLQAEREGPRREAIGFVVQPVQEIYAALLAAKDDGEANPVYPAEDAEDAGDGNIES